MNPAKQRAVLSKPFCRVSYGIYLLLIIPLIPLVLAFIFGGAANLWSRVIGSKWLPAKRLGFMCESESQAKLYFQFCLKAAIPFFGCCYNNICTKVFSVFSCLQLRDGTWVLKAQPSMVCYESQEHHVLVGIAIFALIVYVFGIPAVTLGITLYARKKDLLKDKVYLRLFGLFYREYGLSSS